MPTPIEFAVIAIVVVATLVATRLGEIGDALGRLLHGDDGEDEEESETDTRKT